MHFCTILHPPFSVQTPFLCVCVLQDCRERFDGRSHLRQEQFSQHKIQKSAALKNKISPESLTGPLISSENALAPKDFDFKGRRRDLPALFYAYSCLQGKHKIKARIG